LTNEVRSIAEKCLFERGHFPWSGHPDMFKSTGLSVEQVRDALWGPAADAWRRDLVARYRKERENASS
jgi:hypothetical protein